MNVASREARHRAPEQFLAMPDKPSTLSWSMANSGNAPRLLCRVGLVGESSSRLASHVDDQQLGWVFGAKNGCQCFAPIAEHRPKAQRLVCPRRPPRRRADR